ncbi:hypothetical protein P154DRAFT_421812 [Amniculicola lignicola CBS 123094]|uniref:Heterokaryon incompatibility domain-containing protein n=1 Tax=Amniculicola lignicola CBS 123094 TaxID=1392246 RepID=A0A6A5WZY7_9PLEO|nr:hypothetical protein P154DRAFT_421812 [Amniculicola lignicola CBS 123094]
MRIRSILRHVPIAKNLQFFLGSYRYDPLPSDTSIRLLELIPSSSDKSVVTCSLKTFELRYAPKFSALSYTWGNPNISLSRSISASISVHKNRSTQPSSTVTKITKVVVPERESETTATVRRHVIICDEQIIKVTSNLRDALRMLLTLPSKDSPCTPRYYWIDALCMNQEDLLERNAQVARMADIFQTAQDVIVWLGKEDDFTADALTTIERVASIPEEDWNSVLYTSFYDTTYREPHLTPHNWLGFIALINRPWFKRAWVVQEIALAKSAIVVCGKKTFPWEKLSKTLSFIKKTRWYHHLHTEKLKHVSGVQKNPGVYKRLLQAKLDVGVAPIYLDETRLKINASGRYNEYAIGERNRRPPLRMLLDTHRFSKSTDPRDKVYAFLGLADRNMEPFRSQPDTLTPNYRSTVQEVYTETARALLISSRNLSQLSTVQDPSQTKLPNLPSWVPDLSVKLDPYPLRFRGPVFWRANGKLTWDPNIFTMALGDLDVQGYCLDRVDQVSVLTNETDDPSVSWASIVKLALALDLPYPNPGNKTHNPSRVEVLWRTLITDTYRHTHPAPLETGLLFIDYVLNLQIRHRLMPWSSADEFQPHHSPLSDSIYPEWNTLLDLEPIDSPWNLRSYKQRLTAVVECMFNGTYSPIGLAQLQHELEVSGGKKRRLFKTRGHYLGTGPRSLRQDDEVWILHGGAVPYVLRPKANGKYQLIGEAFVYGVMHGEVQGMSLPKLHITIQ